MDRGVIPEWKPRAHLFLGLLVQLWTVIPTNRPIRIQSDIDSTVFHRRDSPIILCPCFFDLFEKLADPLTRHRAHPDRPQSFVKLVEHQTHRVHQRVHVISFPIAALGRRLQGFLEKLPVVHPVDGEFVGLHVGLVEHEDKGESSLVQDPKTRRTGKNT